MTSPRGTVWSRAAAADEVDRTRRSLVMEESGLRFGTELRPVSGVERVRLEGA